MHCVDLGESFPTHVLLQNLASIQPITGPVKFARSPRTDPPGEEGCVFVRSTNGNVHVLPGKEVSMGWAYASSFAAEF